MYYSISSPANNQAILSNSTKQRIALSRLAWCFAAGSSILTILTISTARNFAHAGGNSGYTVVATGPIKLLSFTKTPHKDGFLLSVDFLRGLLIYSALWLLLAVILYWHKTRFGRSAS